MAGRGAPPKGTRSRARDQARADAEKTTVVPDEELRGFDLPDDGYWGDGGAHFDWPAITVAWWDALRGSPMAQLWMATDWMTLLEVAVLHATFWNGNHSVAAELRLRAAKFALTPEDRARMKIAVGTAPPATVKPTPAKVKAAKQERAAVLQLVSGDD